MDINLKMGKRGLWSVSNTSVSNTVAKMKESDVKNGSMATNL